MKQSVYGILLALCVSLATFRGEACTSAVISGKATPDGRPVLWKNRDTGNPQNCVKYFPGGKYDFVGVVNSESESPTSVWIGHNSAGFAVMNTLSYNMTDKVEGGKGSSRNGLLMYQALAICATVEDFRHFLDTLSQPRWVEANYGAIDAAGGAAMFEVSGATMKMYDANDQTVAPFGYIVRTNFSFNGVYDEGAGYVRYEQADRYLAAASASRSVTPEWIFSTLARSFANPLMGVDLKDGRHNKPHTTGWFVEQDFIARRTSSCSVAIQGVKGGESPELSTMWTVIGYPPVAPALPVWVKGAGRQLPSTLARDAALKASPLCNKALQLRDEVYSYKRGTGSERYFLWELLFNLSGTGYMQAVEPLEEKIFRAARERLEAWRLQGALHTAEAHALYADLDREVRSFFQLD